MKLVKPEKLPCCLRPCSPNPAVVCVQLSGKSFPLCMRQLHQSLRENHHLRHGGRMQYGLFLKGIGLSLEQALQFWRSEFIRGKVDADKVNAPTALATLQSYYQASCCSESSPSETSDKLSEGWTDGKRCQCKMIVD